MRDEDRSALSAPCDFSKECIARVTRCSLDRHLLSLPECADVCGTEFELNAAVGYGASASLTGPGVRQAERLPYNFLVIAFDQAFNKTCIRIARSSTQSMIQMANHKSCVTDANQPVQERDGITSAGHTDYIASVRRKIAGYSRVSA